MDHCTTWRNLNFIVKSQETSYEGENCPDPNLEEGPTPVYLVFLIVPKPLVDIHR